jgi:hypothetical protein
MPLSETDLDPIQEDHIPCDHRVLRCVEQTPIPPLDLLSKHLSRSGESCDVAGSKVPQALGHQLESGAI